MKNFRQLLWISALFLTLACKDDDDASSQNSIIGTWQPAIIYDDGDAIEVDACQKQGRLVFKTDGSYSFSHYSADGSQSDCLNSFSSTGMWEELAPNQYVLNTISSTPFPETIEVISTHQDTIRYWVNEDYYVDYGRL